MAVRRSAISLRWVEVCLTLRDKLRVILFAPAVCWWWLGFVFLVAVCWYWCCVEGRIGRMRWFVGRNEHIEPARKPGVWPDLLCGVSEVSS